MNFTDEELTIAATALRDTLLANLSEAPEYEFSPEFEKKLDKLAGKMKRKTLFLSMLRGVAAAVIFAMISFGVLMAASPNARAAVANWVRNVYENSVFYRFFEDNRNEIMPKFHLSWIPEGFELADKFEDTGIYISFYTEQKTGRNFSFEYYIMDEGFSSTIFDLFEDMESESVSIGGKSGDLYYSDNGVDANLIWMDEDSHVCFLIDGNVGKSVILQIAEGVKLSK